MKPKITLLNWTPDPLETVYSLWEASKNEAPLLSVADVKREVPKEQLEDLFWKVLAQRIPIGEHLNFVFVLEGISVSLREQLVRHRIGTKVGDKVGVDIIPDLPSSSFWSQSMRIQDMGAFASNGMYREPDTLANKRVSLPVSGGCFGRQWAVETDAVRVFRDLMATIEEGYNALVKAGVPMEDAREVIPLGAQHRISWALNLQSLLHILGERGCWILQLGIWGPVIHGMVDELASKVHPMFRRMLAPPCVKGDKFTSCLYRLENQRRITGDDRHAPCPLYLCRDEDGSNRIGVSGGTVNYRANVVRNHQTPVTIQRHSEMVERAESYRSLWGRDPYGWDIDTTP